jgi:hypothetical protein
MKRGIEFPAHDKVKVAIQRHTARHRQNQTSGYLHWQYCTPKNPQPRWRHIGTGAAPPVTPPAPHGATGNTSGTQPSDIVNLPAQYMYSHTDLCSAEFFEDDEDTKHDTDSHSDILTDHD